MDDVKSSLRQAARTALRQLPPDARVQAGAAIASTLRRLPAWQKAQTVLVFQPLPDEPDLTALWADGFEPAKIWAFPKIEADTLALYRVTDLADFAPGSFGILEPKPEPARRLPPSAIDLALIPGLAFDPSGGRLGRGRGFYDRLLADPAWRATTLGIAFRQTEFSAVPRAPHDIPLHGILWSDGIVTFPPADDPPSPPPSGSLSF